MSTAEPDGTLIARIGAEVRDHESRIRSLERDILLVSEGLRQVKDTLGGIEAMTASIDRRLDEHTQKEDRDRSRLMAVTLGQFMAVLTGILLILLERGA